jgi:hypothetical protein
MKWFYHYPRGPRSGPGSAVPVRHHLIDPIRPTRGHIAISPHSGLYAMPSLCGSAEATREWFRAFAACSFLTCRPLRPRGVRTSHCPISRCRHGLRHGLIGSTLPKPPAIRFARGSNFGAYWFAFATACQSARLPLSDQTRTAPGAPEAFTSRLSDGSVTLPAAGYDYDIDWTPMSAGLAPAGTAASFAALARMERSAIRGRRVQLPRRLFRDVRGRRTNRLPDYPHDEEQRSTIRHNHDQRHDDRCTKNNIVGKQAQKRKKPRECGYDFAEKGRPKLHEGGHTCQPHDRAYEVCAERQPMMLFRH